MRHKFTVLFFLSITTLIFTQDTTGGTVDDGGGITDGGITDGGITDGGLDFTYGCIDPYASNYNPEADIDNFTCIYTDCNAFTESMNIMQYPVYQCYLGAVYGGLTCEVLAGMGECDLVISCGFCESENSCSDSQWECADGTCIPSNYFCDGSSEFGNASWPPDCPDGSDENLTTCCENGSYNDDVCNPCDDEDDDGICDDVDDCVGEYDACDICNGPGAIYECGCSGIPTGDCDCNGNTFDECDVCDGDGPSHTCWDNEVVCDADDCSDQPVFDIEVDISYPTDETQILNYQDVDITWNYDGSSTDSTFVDVTFVYFYGGPYIDIARHIYIDDGSVNVDLTRDAAGTPLCDDYDPDCVETIFGKIKIIASDGNDSSEDESTSLIIGDPEGELGINWLDIDNLKVVVDWGWLENHDITFTHEAINAISNFDNLIIYDDTGVNTSTCEGNEHTTGFVELAFLDISQLSQDSPITLNRGFDYCDIGGERIIGYTPGNLIKFMISDDDNPNTFYDIVGTDNNYIDQELQFSSLMNIINVFTFSDQSFSIPNYTSSIPLDERDFDSFSVYNKITSAQMRDCEDPGSGDNLGWCYDSFIEGVTNYVSTLPTMEEASNIKYRVWLLDDADVEILKTYESDGISYTAEDIEDVCTDDDGNLGTLDDCGVCITEFNICDDCYYDDYVGDLNLDEAVNVTDIVNLVNIILSEDELPTGADACIPDVNNDGGINVVDVVTVVNIILGDI